VLALLCQMQKYQNTLKRPAYKLKSQLSFNLKYTDFVALFIVRCVDCAAGEACTSNSLQNESVWPTITKV
jgi:hypothetical protein